MDELKTLVIDTATRRSVVAATSHNSLISYRFNEDPMAHGERLMPMLTQVLREAGWEPGEVQLLAVGKGPGSFTGVRMAMACAKGIGFSLSIPMVAVGSLDAMAWAGRHLSVGRSVAALLDAKKNEVFIAAYGADGEPLCDPQHVAIDSVEQWINALDQQVVLVGEIVQQLRLNRYDWLADPRCDLPHPEAISVLASARWLRTRQDELYRAQPQYVRPPDITKPSQKAVHVVADGAAAEQCINEQIADRIAQWLGETMF